LSFKQAVKAAKTDCLIFSRIYFNLT